MSEEEERWTINEGLRFEIYSTLDCIHTSYKSSPDRVRERKLWEALHKASEELTKFYQEKGYEPSFVH